MDFGFIREVMNEQVRLNVALCEAKHENANLLREKEEALRIGEEGKRKYEELYASHVENEKTVRLELKKIREDVEKTGAIPYDILEDASEASEENQEAVEKEEKSVVIEDKAEKRRAYMKEYMKKKRESKKAGESEK